MLTLDENRIETPTGPKHIYRIVERCFEELVAPTEEAFLAAAVETTRDRFSAQCRITQTLLLRREEDLARALEEPLAGLLREASETARRLSTSFSFAARSA